MRLPFFSLCLLASFSLTAAEPDLPVPLPGAHAHNDYAHPTPLTDALSHHFQSVEADIFLVDDKLLVAHDLEDVKEDRTLEALYLDPLQERVRLHDGQVYPQAQHPFYLLIDIKSEGESTYRALHERLRRYQEMLTTFEDEGPQRRAVTVIISGNRPRALLANLKPLLAAYDGRLEDLPTADPHRVPWISDNWRNHFTWRGEGPVPPEDRRKLESLVAQAHARDLQLRLWAIPDRPEAWALMHEAGVDFINTDRLEDLSRFLKNRLGKSE